MVAMYNIIFIYFDSFKFFLHKLYPFHNKRKFTFKTKNCA